MFKLIKELNFVKETTPIICLKQGVLRGVTSWLSIIGNIAILHQCLTLSWEVIFNDKGVADIIIWYPLLLAFIIGTPKLLNLSVGSTEFFIRAYTIIINGTYAMIFVFLLYSLMISDGYVIGDAIEQIAAHENVDIGSSFGYINSILLVYISFWFFSLYINKHLSPGYLNYASSPIFFIISISTIYAVFVSREISIYNYFNVSPVDGGIRLILSLFAIGMFLVIVRRTVFYELSSNKKVKTKPTELTKVNS
ncbi:hypothetical protein ACQKP8_27120 [Photobacterium alginatilyticum]|uniref:hypothetical protein n=1 Tax=Photobacterium alginatilyticum TaxID=1775171 RepID=UPI00406802D6